MNAQSLVDVKYGWSRTSFVEININQRESLSSILDSAWPVLMII